jgi:hypothetical protein
MMEMVDAEAWHLPLELANLPAHDEARFVS